MSSADLAALPCRKCTKCGRTFPASLEFFYAQANGRYGLKSWCKSCHLEHSREYDQANRGKVYAYRRKWLTAHPNKTAEYSRRYDEANREKRVEKGRAYREANREKVLQATRVWAAKNPGKVALKTRRRRALKAGNGGTHTIEDIQAQHKRQKGKCFYCGGFIGQKYHVDHVVPLTLGGSNSPENLVLACAYCNLLKAAKHPMDFCGRLL